ncbi:hypothetical protein HYFRA_00001032 [Hymenoscyphus fraxineus]|uniref:Uncharacterized protein n=1 Tax=Hymenoscyphus fraxineus TaxID=746836 RepID=A0A9N9KQY8_9HELO|nr:hypothetical protein HYFRA_00001032 [Hymenoscyphus fraxineus]
MPPDAIDVLGLAWGSLAFRVLQNVILPADLPASEVLPAKRTAPVLLVAALARWPGEIRMAFEKKVHDHLTMKVPDPAILSQDPGCTRNGDAASTNQMQPPLPAIHRQAAKSVKRSLILNSHASGYLIMLKNMIHWLTLLPPFPWRGKRSERWLLQHQIISWWWCGRHVAWSQYHIIDRDMPSRLEYGVGTCGLGEKQRQDRKSTQ